MCFNIFKIKIEISYLFVSMLVVYIALDRTGYIIPLVFSILVHEISHIILLLVFKCKIRKIKLIIGSLLVEYDGLASDHARVLSLFGGPFINLIISIAAYISNFEVLCAINLLFFVFNLLPINSLDGGEIFEIIAGRFLSNSNVKIILNVITILFSIAFCVYCFNVTLNFSFIIFSFYILSITIFKNVLKDGRF